jgi:response regulator RpfG family c-di-GMP phosphodiesterase
LLPANAAIALETLMTNTQPSDPIELLVVDGDSTQLRELEDYARESGIAMESATTGEQALQLTLARPAHIWLTCVRLPDMSGIELFRIVKTRRPATQFYLFSERYCANDERLVRAAGASGYLSKPIGTVWFKHCRHSLASLRPRASPRKHPAPPTRK